MQINRAHPPFLIGQRELTVWTHPVGTSTSITPRRGYTFMLLLLRDCRKSSQRCMRGPCGIPFRDPFSGLMAPPFRVLLLACSATIQNKATQETQGIGIPFGLARIQRFRVCTPSLSSDVLLQQPSGQQCTVRLLSPSKCRLQMLQTGTDVRGQVCLQTKRWQEECTGTPADYTGRRVTWGHKEPSSRRGLTSRHKR